MDVESIQNQQQLPQRQKLAEGRQVCGNKDRSPGRAPLRVMEEATEFLDAVTVEGALRTSSHGGGSVVTEAFSDDEAAAVTPAFAASMIRHFSALDYGLFAAMLIVSASIGVYFGFFAKKKQNTTSEYLMGGKTMGIAPVAMSLIASYVSGITLLGVPGETYRYGTQFSTITFGSVLGGICGGVCFLPVFYRLQLNTSYEYLSIRFDRKVLLLGSFLFILTYLLYIPVVIYVPALALNQASGINIHLITPIVCLVCIFYTSLGGIKAVVWTDALQIVIMFGAMFAIIVTGNNNVGGFQTVWQRNKDADRLEFFNLTLDLTTRHTFWNTAFGCIFNWIYQCSVNQSMVQRFLVVQNISRARVLLVIAYTGIVSLTLISSYVGMQIFATYYDCDRLSTKIVGASDQLLPYFVMDVAGSLVGLPGLFMAGVFSAALSSMSTGLNSMAGVLYEYFVKPFMKVKPSEERASFIMKVMCVVIGVYCVLMVIVVQHLEGVIQVVWALEGISSGPMLSLFVSGMFIPWANATGTFIGGVTGLIVMGVICFGNQIAMSSGRLVFPKKPVSTEGCGLYFNGTNYPGMDAAITSTHFLEQAFVSNVTSTLVEEVAMEDVPWIFRISYTWYSPIGLLISLAVGLMATYIIGPTDPKDVHIDQLTPVVHRFFASRCKSDETQHRKEMNGRAEQAEVCDQEEINTLIQKKEFTFSINEDNGLDSKPAR
ncbi:sodium-coupled monocarboxylate transporter 1-like isoform X2 [Ischnura elegans]|uniref:sodium-coupled monocarboxylate transporter 1-like isoform X2 n=1 Tax=Ischnura elegans TaxID=197161 RepID=UPI001ED8ADA9|nr:sodium-coupled monocarboxylate transporter 1-like isoform X2 [Ischnura elegans]